jgi:lipid-A-disaccharide synthase
MARRVFITVAEVSGDKHAAQLVAALRRAEPDIVVEGIGGPEMQAAGAAVLRETVSNAAMGWRGALRAFEIGRILRWTKRRFDDPATRPDLWVGVDSPSMNFHFARAAHDRGIPTLQYVAPQLWAWREGRMKKLRRWVDRLACILPFEEHYFRRHGVDATFVGHPLFDELPAHRAEPGPSFPDRPPVIGLLPGSRKGEAAGNFPRMLEVAVQVRAAFPDAGFLIPTTTATHPIVEARLRDTGAGRAVAPVATVKQDAFDELVPRCDLCLVVSGTATLHVAGFGVPMVVVYAGSGLLWKGVGQFVIRTRTFALVNLLADPNPTDPTPGRKLVREYVPWCGPTAPVAERVLHYLRNPDELKKQHNALNRLIGTLDRPGASDNVARLSLEMARDPGRKAEGRRMKAG